MVSEGLRALDDLGWSCPTSVRGKRCSAPPAKTIPSDPCPEGILSCEIVCADGHSHPGAPLLVWWRGPKNFAQTLILAVDDEQAARLAHVDVPPPMRGDLPKHLRPLERSLPMSRAGYNVYLGDPPEGLNAPGRYGLVKGSWVQF